MADNRTARALAAAESTGVLPDGGIVHGRTMLRGLRLLELAADLGPITVSGLAQASGIDKGTTSRLLASLRETGYVHQDPVSKRYQLGNKAVWLWLRFNDQFPLTRVAEPIARQLAHATGESVTIDILVQPDMECVVSIDSPQPLRVSRRVGERHDLVRSGPGLAVLFALAPEDRERIVAEPGATGTDVRRADVDRELELAGVRGYVTASDESIATLSAPILDTSGLAVSSISVWTPRSRLSAQMPELGAALLAASAEIAAKLHR